MSSTHRHVFPDLDALSRAAAHHLVAQIADTLADQDRYTLALAGGSTPRTLYRVLAGERGDAIPWDRVHLFWGDERHVPHDHPKSNVRMVRETLLDGPAGAAAQVHPMPTDLAPDAAAEAYAHTLQRFFASPDGDGAPHTTFDAVLLGLGGDGHTASLFPENDLHAGDAWVRAVAAPPRHDIPTRLTCTLPVLNGATEAIFLVAGQRKRDALAGVWEQRNPALPATHVQARAATHWFVDEAAHPGHGADR